MNTDMIHSPASQEASSLGQHKVLRNTYMLLGATLAFSAAVAMFSSMLNLPHPGIIVTLVVYFGLLFGISKFQNQGLGIGLVFALTGFMGYTLGPILNMYASLANGTQIITMALGSTALIFFGLSAYVLQTKKDFSFLRGMLFSGIIVAFVAGLAAVFFNLPALSLTVSVMFVLLMSGLILYETSQIIRGGETNYVMATVTLFVSIFNLFISLLQLIGFASSDE